MVFDWQQEIVADHDGQFVSVGKKLASETVVERMEANVEVI